MQDAHDLNLVIEAGIPLVALETWDEPRAIDLLLRLARQRDSSLFQWSVTDGLKRGGFGLQIEQAAKHTKPEDILDYLKHRAEPGIYALCDFHPWFGDEHPKHTRQLKDIAMRHNGGSITIVLVSHQLNLPPELSRLSARFQISPPNRDQILTIVRAEAKKWARGKDGRKVRADNATLQQLVSSLQGLTHAEVTRLCRSAIVDDGAITDSDLPALNKAKFDLMGMDGVLSYEYQTEALSKIGGMANLKQWLGKRREVFSGDVDGIDTPKGILLLGVQGGGKSLAARAVAGTWQVPLLKLDMGALYNKFYGETERNLRESLQLAESMSPCVLWLDEIEKGISSDSNDGGVSGRVLATLLTWMAEHKGRVFLVATSNDITQLPPELVRKGRFDELFFVDLPNAEARQMIFILHLQNRELEPEAFALDELVQASEQFSGAEIEQAIVAALYSALAQEAPVTTDLLLNEIYKTSPLSIVMAEKLTALRHWATERKVVPA